MTNTGDRAAHTIEINILRSKRKSVAGYLLPDGNIEVRAPFSMGTEAINRWLDKYETKFLPISKLYRETRELHPFGYGGEVLFRGEWVPIREAEDGNGGYMALMRDCAVVVKPGMAENDMRFWIEDLFSNLSLSVFKEKLHHYSSLMGIWCRAWTIGNARKRHGSCDSTGKITLSWRIVMMCDAVMDYIIVHELAHLKHMNHAKAFHGEVAAILPDWKERREKHGESCRLLRCGGGYRLFKQQGVNRL